ncbi:hypothetical protein SKAU_G00364700 [Synaphobranchus kaupii]|uniref:Uncharacterized protein n=1 Tax=Synaphobranchus kaupii TaxID=118154 RepID=A0A9Q1EEV7_SYNKA|nr:hypothetical protein SKAU_G00364700 [Synaphobranchus kaupii]
MVSSTAGPAPPARTPAPHARTPRPARPHARPPRPHAPPFSLLTPASFTDGVTRQLRCHDDAHPAFKSGTQGELSMPRRSIWTQKKPEHSPLPTQILMLVLTPPPHTETGHLQGRREGFGVEPRNQPGDEPSNQVTRSALRHESRLILSKPLRCAQADALVRNRTSAAASISPLQPPAHTADASLRSWTRRSWVLVPNWIV